jgi:hypothetical protein
MIRSSRDHWIRKALDQGQGLIVEHKGRIKQHVNFQSHNYSRLSNYNRRIVGGLVNDLDQVMIVGYEALYQGHGLIAEREE